MLMRSKNQFVIKLNVNTVDIHINTISFDCLSSQSKESFIRTEQTEPVSV